MSLVRWDWVLWKEGMMGTVYSSRLGHNRAFLNLLLSWPFFLPSYIFSPGFSVFQSNSVLILSVPCMGGAGKHHFCKWAKSGWYREYLQHCAADANLYSLKPTSRRWLTQRAKRTSIRRLREISCLLVERPSQIDIDGPYTFKRNLMSRCWVQEHITFYFQPNFSPGLADLCCFSLCLLDVVFFFRGNFRRLD